MPTLDALLAKAVSMRATDIHLSPGAPVQFRMGGTLVPISKSPLPDAEVRALFLPLLSEERRREFEGSLDFDLVHSNAQGRFRINLARFQGGLGAVIRILPVEPRLLADLKLPDAVRGLTRKSKGLVLVTGSTSQGKTTTLASMVDEINRTSHKNILTIEDPVEYVHAHKLSVVRQREVGRDTRSFADGLRAALRQDPDVILIGEMRDYETIQIVLTAAETGVLVLSTLHILSIDKMLERLLSYAPLSEEGSVRYLLADCLEGVIHQELLPAQGGGKRVACEILLGTDAVRNILRKRGAYLLRDAITTGRSQGMVTMRQSLDQLLQEQAVTEDVARGIASQYGS